MKTFGLDLVFSVLLPADMSQKIHFFFPPTTIILSWGGGIIPPSLFLTSDAAKISVLIPHLRCLER